jgi:hypothetical protein
MDLTAVAVFLKDFGLPLGMSILFTLALVATPKNPDGTRKSPYLVPGSALDAALAETDRVRSAQNGKELEVKLDWQRLREEERIRANKAEARLAEIIPLMHEQTRLLQEVRLELARTKQAS